MNTDGVTASPSAVIDARGFGLYGDTDKRLKRMLRRSTPYTGPQGNRRFEDWILRVDNKVITGVFRLDE